MLSKLLNIILCCGEMVFVTFFNMANATNSSNRLFPPKKSCFCDFLDIFHVRSVRHGMLLLLIVLGTNIDSTAFILVNNHNRGVTLFQSSTQSISSVLANQLMSINNSHLLYDRFAWFVRDSWNGNDQIIITLVTFIERSTTCRSISRIGNWNNQHGRTNRFNYDAHMTSM